MQSWQALDGHLHHLLLMISLDCLLAICHKKKGVHMDGDRRSTYGCEIKNLFCFTCIFHTCIYMFIECFRNIQVDSVMLLSTLATDR